MWTILFMIFFIWIFGKLFIFGIKATWGVARFFFTLVLLPLALIGLVLKGLLSVAIPILAVVGVVSLIDQRR